jgi:DNA mismatch repair ATPase MutS
MNVYDNYSKRLHLFLAEQEKLDRYSNKLSSLRLWFFIASALSIGFAFVYAGKAYGYFLLSISLLLFMIIVFRHEKVINQANRYSKMAEINKQCLQRIDNDWTEFKDAGQEYANPNHAYIDDLDIFGHASLFQWINTANTYHGREFVSNMLAKPEKDIDSINKNQIAIKELALKLEFCQGLQCEGMGSEVFIKNPEMLFDYAENKSRLFRLSWIKYIFYILPGLTIASLVISYFFRSVSFYLPFLLLILQVIINFWGHRRVNSILGTLYSHKIKIEFYQHLLELVEQEDFVDKYLLELKLTLFNTGASASEQIKNLDKIMGLIAFKYNPIVHIIINNLVFWDFHCVFALDKWKERSGASLRKWIYTVGKFEALSSMAMISQLNPQWCFPKFVNGNLVIAAKDMGHPLISNKSRIPNSLLIENQICVVTGSNMSGKTTLLRTIGINLVLAYAGAPVCAKEFECSVMDIFTSMRITDDLNSGISTFYAELLRIKMLIDYSKKEKAMLFLIDEVFRGTNSHDRVTGAKSVLMNLNKSWIIGLISTHDFELCDFENDKSGRIVNYHFVETYSNNEIHFDYKLRPGRCKTTNAKYLMKMVGIEIQE